VHYFQSLDIEVEVLRDDEINLNSLDFLCSYAGVVLSPGPGLPDETRSMMGVIAHCQSIIPVFGVCLGMQGIGAYLGGTLTNLNCVRHGISRKVNRYRGCTIFNDVTFPMEVGLYHSWTVLNVPKENIVATDEEGNLMAVACEERLLYGVQFHPESIMTSQGKKIIENISGIIFGIFIKKTII
jgi:anthranilate synthase component 2